MLSAAFPPLGLAGAAWIAPGLILFSALGCGGGRAFRLGFLGGWTHYLSSLYWLLAMPDTFHGVPVGPAFGWLALSAYCALFPALWVWLCWRTWPGRTAPGLPADAVLDKFFSANVLRRGVWAFNAALFWVALEMARGRLLTGFPWNFLGVSQYKMLPLIQIAAVTGVYGVSFIVVWLSVALAMALLALARQPGRGVWGEAGLPLLTAVVVASFGANRLAKIPPATKELKVALVQPGFAQTLIWSAGEDLTRLEKVVALSKKALADNPNLLIWPEGVVAALMPADDITLSTLLDLAGHKTWLVASTDDEQTSAQGAKEYFNSSILVSPAGARAGVYHKRRLVIFGEYVPRWLAFLKWVTPIDGAFTPGKEPVQFAAKNPDARFSVLICFEDAFGEEAREHVMPDTDFLVNLTNDGWFGNGAASWQHAANAIFRAVENGVPLVRCTNNGLTCWVDGQGRLREIFSVDGSVYDAGFMTVKIPLRAGGGQERTFYNLHGDWFAWSCCGLAAVLGAGSIRLRRDVF